MAVMSFLGSARDGVASSTVVSDPRTRSDRYGVLTPMSEQFAKLVDDFGFFHVLRASQFDATLAYLAFRRAREVEWSLCASSPAFLHYAWEAATVVGLSEMFIGGFRLVSG